MLHYHKCGGSRLTSSDYHLKKLNHIFLNKARSNLNLLETGFWVTSIHHSGYDSTLIVIRSTGQYMREDPSGKNKCGRFVLPYVIAAGGLITSTLSNGLPTSVVSGGSSRKFALTPKLHSVIPKPVYNKNKFYKTCWERKGTPFNWTDYHLSVICS